MTSLALLAAAVLATPAGEFSPAAKPVAKTIKAAGYEWTYHLNVPVSYTGKTAVPLVFVFHGAGGNGELYLDRNGWSAMSDKGNFIACAPTGLAARPQQKSDFLTNPNLWNSGQLQPRSPRGHIDDLEFFDALLAQIKKDYKIDSARVYCTGHSNGAGMTFRLGAERTDVFAAIAPVMGQYAVSAPPKAGIPTLAIFGEKDPLCLWDGGERTLPWGKSTVPPVMDSVERWAKGMGCPTKPASHTSKGGLETWEYGPGKDKAGFTVVKILGQGHGWPGGRYSGLRADTIGPSVKTYDATPRIWEFFQKHAR